jgi:ADP-heptose:LPS heptosyltransferase
VRVKIEWGGLGDEIAMTPVLRELHRLSPNDQITVEGFQRPMILENNPNLGVGSMDSGRVVSVCHGLHYNQTSLPRKFARQVGIDLVDDTPEVFLTDQERAITFGMEDWSRTVAIDTWAGKEARRWPIGRFRQLAEILRRAGWLVLEVGKHPPSPGIENGTIVSHRSFLGALSIRGTAALLARCTLYVGNDSGLFHLAAAVGTPQVVIFGPVPGRNRAYWNTMALGTIERCDGCGETCARPGKYGPSCLMNVSPETVVATVELAARRFHHTR